MIDRGVYFIRMSFLSENENGQSQPLNENGKSRLNYLNEFH